MNISRCRITLNNWNFTKITIPHNKNFKPVLCQLDKHINARIWCYTRNCATKTIKYRLRNVILLNRAVSTGVYKKWINKLSHLPVILMDKSLNFWLFNIAQLIEHLPIRGNYTRSKSIPRILTANNIQTVKYWDTCIATIRSDHDNIILQTDSIMCCW